MEDPIVETVDLGKVCDIKESKRIIITNCNSLLGYSVFEHMRNDHIAINDPEVKPHRFLGTLNHTVCNGTVNSCPSESIKVLDSTEKPKTFTK